MHARLAREQATARDVPEVPPAGLVAEGVEEVKVKFTLSIGYNGKHEDIVDVPDDATHEDIQGYYEEWCQNYLNGGWERMEDGE